VRALLGDMALDDGPPAPSGHEGQRRLEELGGDALAPGLRAKEAVETGAETLAVACPFCTVMLDDGVRETGAEMRVADVSTLLAESLDA